MNFHNIAKNVVGKAAEAARTVTDKAGEVIDTNRDQFISDAEQAVARQRAEFVSEMEQALDRQRSKITGDLAAIATRVSRSALNAACIVAGGLIILAFVLLFRHSI